MAVKTFAMRRGQRLLVDFGQPPERAVVEVDTRGDLAVWNDKCRHRGGPLHLCYRDNGGVLRCPWHGRPAGKFAPSHVVAAIFLSSKQSVTLITETRGAPWPVKYLPMPDCDVRAGS